MLIIKLKLLIFITCVEIIIPFNENIKIRTILRFSLLITQQLALIY